MKHKLLISKNIESAKNTVQSILDYTQGEDSIDTKPLEEINILLSHVLCDLQQTLNNLGEEE
ncbi:MAG: hypothetical protein RR959_08345 [Erysipelotrichaceae bacterium]